MDLRLLALLCTATPVAAQLLWTHPSQSQAPPPRTHTGITFHRGLGETVLFGGIGSNGRLNDTWTWNGQRWREVPGANEPSPRSTFAMVPFGEEVVLFGGDTGSSHLDETWVFDGVNWRTATSPASPPSRVWPVLAYDEARRKLVLFGGYDGTNYFGDTWEWDGSNWTQHLTPGPSPRAHHSMAWSPDRQRVVLHGGHANGPRFGDTWEWDGATWSRQALNTALGPSASHAMTYDGHRRTVLSYGRWEGQYYNDLRESDGVGWSSVSQVAAPPAGQHTNIAVDTVRDVYVLWHEELGSVFEAHDPVARFSTIGLGCPGTAGSPALESADGSRPLLGATLSLRATRLSPGTAAAGLVGASDTHWLHLGLPIDLSPIGMQGCVLRTSVDVVHPLLNLGGEASWALPIPNEPSLLDATFHVQAFALDHAATPLGAVLSNGASARVGSL